MGFFGSFRFGSGLFDGVADSFRDAFCSFTLFPGDDDIEPENYDETTNRTVADAFKDVNQTLAIIFNNARQTGIIKPKNGLQRS